MTNSDITTDDASDDDWDAYKREIKPLKGRERIQKTEVKKIKMRDIVISGKEPVIPQKIQHQPLPAKQVKKLKRQDNLIDATIDLHGMTLLRAHTAMIGFIKKAWTNELRCLEIVTGKGDRERGTGKIRREVPLWLQADDIRACILHVEENMKTGGGSYIVLLRRQKKRG